MAILGYLTKLKWDLGLASGAQFLQNTELFFNENLSTDFQHLSWMCRVLKRKTLITGSWFCGGKLYYKVSDTSKPVKVMRSSELNYNFPDVVFE